MKRRRAILDGPLEDQIARFEKYVKELGIDTEDDLDDNNDDDEKNEDDE